MKDPVFTRVTKNTLIVGVSLVVVGIAGLLYVTNSQARFHAAPPASAPSPGTAASGVFTYDSTKKYIYLTFDDGPQLGTVTCFNLCRAEAVKASFFMVGLHANLKSDGREIVNMIRSAYPRVTLANHSFSHANNQYLKFYHHSEQAAADMFQAQQSLQVPYLIARLPGNRAWVRQGEVKATSLARPLARLLDSAGYNVIGWDLEWDFNRKSARPVQSSVTLAREVDSAFIKKNTHIPNHLVILTHDRMFRRPGDSDSLAKFIRILKQHPDYVFETVDHYPGLKKLRP